LKFFQLYLHRKKQAYGLATTSMVSGEHLTWFSQTTRQRRSPAGNLELREVTSAVESPGPM
jgi:hypothetical protein